MNSIIYPDSWIAMSKEDKVKEVTRAHGYMMKHFSKSRYSVIHRKTYEILKEIHNGSSEKKP